MATTFTNGRFFDYRAINRTPGAALYSYAAGTLDPLATYTDQGGGTPNANPVICDVNGGADVWRGTSAYKFRLYTDTIDNGGTLIDEWDNIVSGESDAAISWGAVTSIVGGVLTRHASIAAAVTALGSTVATILVRDDTTVSAGATVAATTILRIDNGAVITLNGGATLTVNGAFDAPRAQCFTGPGKVVFGPTSTSSVMPEWWGAKADATIAGAGTDSTAAYLACIAASTDDGLATGVPIREIDAGHGNYLVSNLVLPPVTALRGKGRHFTNFIVKDGTTGIVMTDSGNAAKIMLEGFSIYARSVAGVTHGIRLGYGTQQHGTEGYVRDVWVRDVDGASGEWGIDINGNVGRYSGLVSQDCAGSIRIVGIANQASELVAYGATTTGVELNLCDVDGVEIEAPGNSCVPLLLSGNADVSGLVVALANGTTISHLVEIGASCATWRVAPLNLAFGDTPAGITVSNGNFKRADGTYFGGNATAGSRNGERHYSSETDGQIPQSFMLRLINSAGTMQHRISTTGGATTALAGAINGASATLANSPTGADASTAMVSGGKIGGTTASVFWFDTISQKAESMQIATTVVGNSTTSAVNAIPVFQSIDINGVTRTRFGIQLTGAASGTGFSINTGNFGAGTLVQVLVNGFLSH